MEFGTREFEAAHGKRPGGRGQWAFEFVGAQGTVGSGRWRVEFAPSNLMFSEAKKWARVRAKELNCFLVNVCS